MPPRNGSSSNGSNGNSKPFQRRPLSKHPLLDLDAIDGLLGELHSASDPRARHVVTALQGLRDALAKVVPVVPSEEIFYLATAGGRIRASLVPGAEFRVMLPGHDPAAAELFHVAGRGTWVGSTHLTLKGATDEFQRLSGRAATWGMAVERFERDPSTLHGRFLSVGPGKIFLPEVQAVTPTTTGHPR